MSGQTFFTDPLLPLGYDFTVGRGDPNFASVVLPAVGDNVFDLLDCGGSSLGTAHAGVVFNFSTGGLDLFRGGGNDAKAGLGTNSPTAIVDRVAFPTHGKIDWTTTP